MQDNGDNGDEDYVKTVSYDGYGRVSNTRTILGANGVGGDYSEEVTYDQYGRPFQTFDAANDPNGATGYQGTQNRYNAHGYLESVGDVLNGSNNQPLTVYQQILETDARGNTSRYQLGNGIITSNDYDLQTGRMEAIQSHYGVTNIQSLSYQWDTVGNLEHRQELSGGKNLHEYFGYDGLNRLTRYDIGNSNPSQKVWYNNLGNITSKQGVGSYSYGQNGAGPHAATTIAGQVYHYDSNGNNTSGGGRTLDYSTFDKPLSITKGGHTTAFEYGPDRARYKRTDQDGTDTKTTWYLGNLEVIEKADGTKELKRYIGDVAIVSLTLDSNEQLTDTDTHYRHYDHLGSLDVITDEAGAIVEELSFDPWGERRNGVDWNNLTATELAGFFDSTISGKGAHGITTRGYTGHEMLDEVGIIHMNGRIYDAKIARFVQADPIIQDPLNTQSLNRYSYVWNNPLNATDPSGFVGNPFTTPRHCLNGNCGGGINSLNSAYARVGSFYSSATEHFDDKQRSKAASTSTATFLVEYEGVTYKVVITFAGVVPPDPDTQPAESAGAESPEDPAFDDSYWESVGRYDKYSDEELQLYAGRGARSSRRTSNLSPSQVTTNARARSLINDIRQFRPKYRYDVVGGSYTTRDIRNLEQALRTTQLEYARVPQKYRESVSQSFRNQEFKARALTQDVIVYRHWGGRAGETGSPWFSPTHYARPGNARRYLALPEGNSATNVTIFRIPKGTRVLFGRVAPQDGNPGFGNYARGGGVQIYVPNPSVTQQVGPAR